MDIQNTVLPPVADPVVQCVYDLVSMPPIAPDGEPSDAWTARHIVATLRARGYLSITAAPMTVPVGWKLAPVEPTPEMILKGGIISLGKPLNERSVKTIYSAMLSVAPLPGESEVPK